MWLGLINQVKKHFDRTITARVLIGRRDLSMLNVKSQEKGVLVIYRGDEEYESDGYFANVTFYIEAWVKDESKTLESGYNKLSELENIIENAINDYQDKIINLDDNYCWAKDGIQIANVFIESKQGDHDSIRPLLGTQYTIKTRLYIHR